MKPETAPPIPQLPTPHSWLDAPLEPAQARSIVHRLAKLALMRPALPLLPPAGDPVARFLLATYGMPSTGGAK